MNPSKLLLEEERGLPGMDRKGIKSTEVEAPQVNQKMTEQGSKIAKPWAGLLFCYFRSNKWIALTCGKTTGEKLRKNQI